MGRRPPVCSHLDNAARVSGSPNHGSAFPDSVTDWLLDIEVSAGLDRRDGHERVPMVRCGYYDNPRALALEHLSIVLVSLWLIARELFDLLSSGVQLIFVDVTHGNNARLARLDRGPQDVH